VLDRPKYPVFELEVKEIFGAEMPTPRPRGRSNFDADE
jgi:hypothetical protein